MLLLHRSGLAIWKGIASLTITDVTTLTRATRIAINSDTLDETDGTGHCPSIGTQVFSVDSGSKKNLILSRTD